MRPAPVATLFLCLLSGLDARAAADARDALDGTIVRLEGDRAFVDAGAARGLKPGLVVSVLRTVTVKHPVTGEALTDHFPMGSMTVEEVGGVLSFGKLEKRIVAAVKIGDVIRVGRRPPPEPAATSPAPAGTHAAQAAPTPETLAALELARVWSGTIGEPPGRRVEILSQYLRTHPGGPWSTALDREIATFQSMDTQLREAAARVALAETTPSQKEKARPDKPAPIIQGSLPSHLYQRDPLDVAIFVGGLHDPARIRAAFAYVRRVGEQQYQRVPLGRDGDGYYFRARVDPQWVRPPGVDVFVEVIDDEGSGFTAGTAERPGHVPVDALPGDGPLVDGAGHSAVNGFFEFVDWNRFRGNDYHLLAESDFLYRLGGIFYSVRTGFGVLYGKGGSVAQLDSATPCDPNAATPAPSCGREVGFNYGYIEGEFRFARLFGMAARLAAGQTMSGNGVGAELKMRIGPEIGTSLVIGGSILKDIGALGLLSLQWDAVRDWPMSASVIVTNQPSQTDVGVRVVYQIAYRAKSWLQPALRLGYGARTIDHGGLSIGLGLVMGW